MKLLRPLLLLLFLPLMIQAITASTRYAWPVEKILLTATFGESRGDHFHSGIDLGGDGQDVHPIAAGQVVYYFDEAEHPLYRGFGNGNLMVIEHKENRRSYYFHMKKGSVATGKTRVEPNDIIGITANTGRSFGAHLHLSIGDKKGYLNPLSLLPDYPDRIAPKIASLLLFVDERTITLPDKYRVSGINDFRLLSRVWDSQEKIRRLNTLGPSEVLFQIDDQPVRKISFDKLIEKNGRLTTSDGSSFAEVYTPSGYFIGGEYRNLIGLHRLKVTARDFQGNSTTKTVEITFR